MPDYTLYRTSNGEIIGGGSFSAESGGMGMTGCGTISGKFLAATHYVWEGEAEPRPVMAIMASALEGEPGDTIGLSGIPEGASVTINGGTSLPVLIDPLVLTLQEPGQYRLIFRCWPYQPFPLVVTCT